MRKMILAAALAVSPLVATLPAAAQVAIPSGLVNVTVGDVILKDILTNVEVEALNDVLNNNQLQVQVPIGVAANVCNVSAAVLGKAGTAGTCEAKSGSTALAQAVRKQYLKK